MKKLRKQRRKLSKRLARNQRWLKRSRMLRKAFRKHDSPKGAKRERFVINWLHNRVKRISRDLKILERKIEAKRNRGEKNKKAFLDFLEDSVGKIEGSSWQRSLAAYLNNPWTWAWCSSFLAYGLLRYGGFRREDVPSNEEYSGMWLTWKNGERVNRADIQLGDFLIFDWGNGGTTDHVAAYVGDNLKIGGNENDRVEKDAVPWGNVVGIVRPNWDLHE